MLAYSSLPLGGLLVYSFSCLGSLAVAKHLYIAGILPFVIAPCLLNYPLIHPQFRSYLECKTFSRISYPSSSTSAYI
jgi:hypothetical protein